MNWVAVLTSLGALLGAAGLGGWFKTWLDHKAGKRKQTDEVALELVGKLTGRVEKLERDLVDERARCEIELRLLRHDKNRLHQLIYSLLHLFDVPARQRKVLLDSVRGELAAMEAASAAEKGAVIGTAIRET